MLVEVAVKHYCACDLGVGSCGAMKRIVVSVAVNMMCYVGQHICGRAQLGISLFSLK